MARRGLSGLKLSARLLLGDAALVSAGVALCTAPAWLYAALPGVLGVAAGALALPLPFAGWAMLRLPFAARPPAAEDGIRLRAEDAPALFREIEQVRARLGAPALDAVYLNSEFNASIRQHRQLLGRTRNVLWLGQPLLEMLSADACRAILAHECAHIAGSHGRYASRVYFARLQWQEAARQLERRKGLSTGPLRLFMNWHVPRFLAASLGFARECEYEADAQSAQACGAAAAANALVAVSLQARALREYWPAAYAQAVDAQPPSPHARLAGHAELAFPRDEAEAQAWLDQALCRPTTGDDTHPSLSDRLAALHALDPLHTTASPEQRDTGPSRQNAIQTPATRAAPASTNPLPWRRASPTAAEEWLGDQRLPLAQTLDASQRDAIEQTARELRNERDEAIAGHHDLMRKQRLRALSADERASMAWYADMLTGDADSAAVLLEQNLHAHPGHVPTLCQLAALQLRRARMAPTEASRLEAAAEVLWTQAANEPGPQRLPCLRQLTAAALRRGDLEQARAWRLEADLLERQTQAGDAAPRFQAHGLNESDLRKLADTLDPLLRTATGVWLLRDTASNRLALLVLARDSALARAIGKLTGEQSYLRRDCEMLLARLLPRVRQPVEPILMEAGDPLLNQCTQACLLRRAGA
ncbi:M48 family metallopeptidase [Achromobacter sp. SD115]|uniref:M48 family metallopeptidase n=1 Tax=Achromobacter sp. SD115 TaxID=2782011 RepID=UPI001A96A599|nr:M48 family metallopeptidase [Achromobacter sp. SD115]MBO1012070.1 M48 family metallopeptidase [Achromobacter sp. SD115]